MLVGLDVFIATVASLLCNEKTDRVVGHRQSSTMRPSSCFVLLGMARLLVIFEYLLKSCFQMISIYLH